MTQTVDLRQGPEIVVTRTVDLHQGPEIVATRTADLRQGLEIVATRTAASAAEIAETDPLSVIVAPVAVTATTIVVEDENKSRIFLHFLNFFNFP